MTQAVHKFPLGIDTVSASQRTAAPTAEIPPAKVGGDLPLCVDLDGTLIKTDLLVEGTLLLLKRNPLYLFKLPIWLSYGKATLKREIFIRVRPDVRTLPYNLNLLTILRKEHETGRRLVLATASDSLIAGEVAQHLGIFSEVVASDGVCNVSSHSKAQALSSRFGERGFDYAGNARVDCAVWEHANSAIVVNASSATARRAAAVTPVTQIVKDRPSLVKSLPRALRIHQWAKNLLLFVPLLASHKMGQPYLIAHGVLAFIAFCLCASSVYVLNDLLDVEVDRRHRTKKNRPFAAGDIPVVVGPPLAAGLLLASALIAITLPLAFQLTLLCYYGLTLAYSLFLKRKLLVDVYLLAGLYSIRVLAGGLAVGVVCSPWLLAFSMFLFLSLALVKRYAELFHLDLEKSEKTRGRGYQASDREIILSLGAGCGLMCVLVLALYINSPQVMLLYKTPAMLWLLCPALMYWVSRIWIIAHRGKMDCDPLIFAIKDKVSYLVGLCGAAVVVAASYQWSPL